MFKGVESKLQLLPDNSKFLLFSVKTFSTGTGHAPDFSG